MDLKAEIELERPTPGKGNWTAKIRLLDTENPTFYLSTHTVENLVAANLEAARDAVEPLARKDAAELKANYDRYVMDV